MEVRKARAIRRTYETQVEVDINLDGTGTYNIETGIGFFNHMLSLFSKHSLIDLNVQSKGDLDVDCHHTVEDTGIVIGQCIKSALGGKKGIKRYGTAFVPMDEALCQVSIDISGRPFLVFDADFPSQKLGDFDTETTEDFFRAFAFNAGITLHAKVLYGRNTHHMIEGLFKALGRALMEACTIDERIEGVISTKGTL